MTKVRLIAHSIFFTAALWCGRGYAVCLDSNGIGGWHPGVQEEFNSSIAVIVARAELATDLFEDTDDPIGITATIYRIRVIKVLKGKLAGVITTRSENDSGRFPLEMGKKYLLFISRDSGNYVVSNCGNSGPLSESTGILKQLGASEADAK